MQSDEITINKRFYKDYNSVFKSAWTSINKHMLSGSHALMFEVLQCLNTSVLGAIKQDKTKRCIPGRDLGT